MGSEVREKLNEFQEKLLLDALGFGFFFRFFVVMIQRIESGHIITELEEKYQGRIEKLESLNIDISSKMIRSWIESGRSLAYYVPEQVISYIRENNIYKDCDKDEV